MNGADRIKIFVFDVDGTLTPGTLFFGADGEAYKEFHVRDGMALGILHRLGYITGFITGRNSDIVRVRAHELKVDFLLMGVTNKEMALKTILHQYHAQFEEVAFMGDDLNDLPLLKKVGVSGCPSDACEENIAAVDFVSRYPGGAGAAREFVEGILKSQDKWKDVLELFNTDGPVNQ